MTEVPTIEMTDFGGGGYDQGEEEGVPEVGFSAPSTGNSASEDLAAETDFSEILDVGGSAQRLPVTGDPRQRYSNAELFTFTVHQVAREGDVTMMERFLQRFVQHQQKRQRVNLKDAQGMTALHYAVRMNNFRMSKYLIDTGADVQCQDEEGHSPLHLLAKYKHREGEDRWSCMQLLIDSGANVNAVDFMGLTPLHHACIRGNTSVVKYLVECKGVDLESCSETEMRAMHFASMYGQAEIVEVLLAKRCRFRCKDNAGTTPFHLACQHGKLEVAKLLVERARTNAEKPPEVGGSVAIVDETTDKPDASELTTGAEFLKLPPPSEQERQQTSKDKRKSFADIFAIDLKTGQKAPVEAPELGGVTELIQEVDNDDNLPLHLAVENANEDLVELFIELAKANNLRRLLYCNRKGDESCLHLAVNAGKLSIFRKFIAEGADINARDREGLTPLLLAAAQNSHDIVKFMLDNGANPEKKDKESMSPLMVASKFGHVNTMRILIEHGADVQGLDKDERSALMLAAEENRTEAMELLLTNETVKTMVEDADRFGNTALHLASVKGHHDCVTKLLESLKASDYKNNCDQTSLHVASMCGKVEVITELIKRDRSTLNFGDEEGNTALHLAATSGSLACVVMLVQLGAKIDMRNARQWTPLDCAAANGWEKVARTLLESGVPPEPQGRLQVCALHLACQFGHVQVVNLLLEWNCDVTFRAGDGRNSLDFAIDYGQKECALALLTHETWKSSLKNAVTNPHTGMLTTPMRKLMAKMEDVAEVVCNQCVSNNNKKPTDDNFSITFLYEFVDDTFLCHQWAPGGYDGQPPVKRTSRLSLFRKTKKKQKAVDEDVMNDIEDEQSKNLKEYTTDRDELMSNHPLSIMVNSKCERLILHPMIASLLHHKWNNFVRYIFYVNFLSFLAYVILINVYMMLIVPFYFVDWAEQIDLRKYLANASR